MEAPYTATDNATAATSSSVPMDAETDEPTFESDASASWDPEAWSNLPLRRDWDTDGIRDAE